MARVEARPTIQLACTECKERTYTTRKNKKNDPNRLELMKYCPRDRRHTLHREAKKAGQPPQGCSSIGRALVSKTSGCRFESYRPCHFPSVVREKNH